MVELLGLFRNISIVAEVTCSLFLLGTSTPIVIFVFSNLVYKQRWGEVFIFLIVLGCIKPKISNEFN